MAEPDHRRIPPRRVKVTRPMASLEILYEDNHLLVVNKPAGIATMGAESGPTLHSLAADYIKRKYRKPGKAFVGVVSRLDAMTSGVIVLARTSKAASRLSDQFAGGADKLPQKGAIEQALTRDVEKVYLAGIDGSLTDDSGEWVDDLFKDDAAHRMRVVDVKRAISTPKASRVTDAKRAVLRYHRLTSGGNESVVAVRLITGRKHQIRVQFAERGHPVLGDRKYGSTRDFPAGIALHSWRLRIVHPTRRTPMWFQAEPPASWKQLLKKLVINDELQRRLAHSLAIDWSDAS